MRKIVLPLVETDRSLLALQYAKKHFTQEQAEIILVMSDESLGISATREEEAAALSLVERKLDVMKQVLDGYQVVTKAFVGKAGPCIVKVAREYNADYIVMTKSARSDTLSMVGKTTDYVLNNAYCNVLIISENRMNSGEYKGLIYKKAQATVNLRGQIGDKQSECLLPSVDADCNYHFDVTVGKIRFFHTAYNPETGNWDMPPAGDQTASIDITAGETADILVKANSIDGKADRIRIINRGMKQEAVFEYKITAAAAPQPLEIPEAPGAMPAPAVISLEDEEAVYEAIEPETEKIDDTVGSLEFDDFIEEALSKPEIEIPALDEEAKAVEELAELEPETELETEPEELSIVDDYLDRKYNEISFNWDDIDFKDDKEDTFDSTLTGLEMFTPHEDEISSIVDELKETVTSLDNDIAERESQTIKFGIPDEEVESQLGLNFDLDADFGSDIRFDVDSEPESELESASEPEPEPANTIEDFFESTGLTDADSKGIISPAFDDIFEMIPTTDPVKNANTSTLEYDFDEIINEFRTSQMGYVGTGITEEDDNSLDEFK